jgi:pyruvate dehydrogenase E2 component (dihydrolipoamide acetyltransferase)
MTNTTITVPDIGGAAAEVVEVLVAVGDVVELEQSLIVLESDKASMEIPATAAGTVTALKIAVGDQLSEGDVVLVVSVEASADANVEPQGVPSSEQAAAPEAVPSAGDATASASTASTAGHVHLFTVEVPDIGTDEAVEIVELCVAVGDEVAEGDSLLVLESDKASMEVPAPAAGTVTQWLVTTGDEVRQGTAIVSLSTLAVSTETSAVTAAPVV